MSQQSPHPNTSPVNPFVPLDPPISEGYNSCPESDNAPPCNIDNVTSHQVPSLMNNAPCQESKMDSLGTHSEATHVGIDTTTDTSSTSIAGHAGSLFFAPKTNRKKKGEGSERRFSTSNLVAVSYFSINV